MFARARNPQVGMLSGPNCWIPDRPTSWAVRNDGHLAAQFALAGGTGSAVTDLIFSIAKREVTFFSGTALISFL